MGVGKLIFCQYFLLGFVSNDVLLWMLAPCDKNNMYSGKIFICSCISYAYQMHLATHTLTLDMFCIHSCQLSLLDFLVHITWSCVYVMPRSISCSIFLSMSCLLYALQHFLVVFVFCLSFIFLVRLAPLMHHLLPLFISSFLSLLPLVAFVYL